MFVESFKQLTVWQKSIVLVREIYLLSDNFPRHELYGLSSQMRRAAISIPSNIAEGKKRKTLKDYIQFLHVASGSAAELETQIIIVKDLYKKIDFVRAESILIEVQKMLAILIKRLEEFKSSRP